MMKTRIGSSAPRTFRVWMGYDDPKEETISAVDFLTAFCMYLRSQGIRPVELDVEYGGGLSNIMWIWIGDKLYKIMDVTGDDDYERPVKKPPTKLYYLMVSGGRAIGIAGEPRQFTEDQAYEYMKANDLHSAWMQEVKERNAPPVVTLRELKNGTQIPNNASSVNNPPHPPQ